jgi:hypothetical protein
MSERQTIQIDLDKINNLAHTGVRRAVLFMGLGLNAARREDFKDYELSKLPILPGQTNLSMDFFPPGLPDERIRYFKEEFAIWITGCGLRELLEYYALFLDQIHSACLLIHSRNKKLGSLNPVKAHSYFNSRFGIPRKLDEIRRRFGFGPGDADMIKSLYEARNCLTHDLGKVSRKRCGPDDRFAISWKALQVSIKPDAPGGERALPDRAGKASEAPPSSVAMTSVKRERAFAAGEKLVFTQQDLAEICFFFNAHAIPSMLQAFVEFLKAEGIHHSADGSGK